MTQNPDLFNRPFQISKYGADILASEGFLVQRRGIIQVKGKGQMETFFVHSKSDQLQEEANGPDGAPTSADSMNKSSSLAEVMFNMVQVIKKQNLANSLSVPTSKTKSTRLSLSFNSKQSGLSNNLASILPLRGSSGHSTRSAIIGDYNQMKSSSCKLHRIKSEKPSRKFTSRRRYLSKARLSDGFTELNSNGGHSLLEYARNQALDSQLPSTSSTSDNPEPKSGLYSSSEKLADKNRASLKISRNCRSVSPTTIEEQVEEKRQNSKKDKIDYL